MCWDVLGSASHMEPDHATTTTIPNTGMSGRALACTRTVGMREGEGFVLHPNGTTRSWERWDRAAGDLQPRLGPQPFGSTAAAREARCQRNGMKGMGLVTSECRGIHVLMAFVRPRREGRDAVLRVLGMEQEVMLSRVRQGRAGKAAGG